MSTQMIFYETDKPNKIRYYWVKKTIKKNKEWTLIERQQKNEKFTNSKSSI